MEVFDWLSVWWSNNVSDRIAGLRYWLHNQRYKEPLIMTAKKLEKANPEILPDTVTIHSWFRLWLPVKVAVRMMGPSEKILACVADCLDKPDSRKFRWIWLEDGKKETVYVLRGENTYEVTLKGG